MPTTSSLPWSVLETALAGDLHRGRTWRMLYATDASVYRELPLAVVIPRTKADLVVCVRFCAEHGLPLTPRAGGTSLAGQAVGAGLVVDCSEHLREILEINVEQGYAVVEPGVVRDQLNAALEPLGYWFGPNTSTANRCTLGGMFGNNSCGSTSITVGSTREHVLAARVVLSDGSILDTDDFRLGEKGAVAGAKQVEGSKGSKQSLRRRIGDFLLEKLSDEGLRNRLAAAYPRPEVQRRNTGYALDLLARQAPFTPGGPPFNLCSLLAGSEGTLAVTTRLKVRILPLPPRGTGLVAIHCTSVRAALLATQVVMELRPFMCELMDDTILRLARQNPDQAKNAAFVAGDPRALLLVEFRAATDAEATDLARAAETRLRERPDISADVFAYGYLRGPAAVKTAWDLRAAGLGILGNIIGDAKAVACIEDTAVALPDLADYMDDVGELMEFYGQNAVYYAHAGAGEIHLRPVLDLKTTAGREDFYRITRDVAALVKKYRGSLSGEHGDGRVRAAFLPDQLGPEVYALLVELKKTFDPQHVLNPGKIVEAPPMNESLRYEADVPTPEYATALDWSSEGGLVRAAEKCNGSGDCRKTAGGAMCPSYRALLSEPHGTRGRANVLREVLTRNQHDNPFEHPALAATLGTCLSCKACTSECPSTVDMTNLKAEYLYQRGNPSLRSRLVAANETLYGLGSKLPGLANFGLKVGGPLMKRLLGIAPQRSLPKIPAETFMGWAARTHVPPSPTPRGTLHLYADEFVNLQDPHVGIATLTLLRRLNYAVTVHQPASSGRAHLSKGMLDGARERAETNVRYYADRVSADVPLVGLEPSAILGFRDEYPKLLRGDLAEKARVLATHVFTFDEFLYREITAGRLTAADFGQAPVNVVLHVHCHEKALGDAGKVAAALSLPEHATVRLLDSGCCGMAGSFGYEAEHYDLSVRIAEQSLLRHLRDLPVGTQVVAAGTSCRHQVWDLLGVRVRCSAEVLLGSYGR